LINYLKSIVFQCDNPKYQEVDNKVRYWHVNRRQCFPDKCKGGTDILGPKLLVNEGEFARFKVELNMFNSWTASLEKKLWVPFIGVVHWVIPRYNVALIENTPFHSFEGYVLVYKECLLENTFFEDFVYVFIDKKMQDRYAFQDKDTVSGTGHFHIDYRGLVTIISPNKLKLILRGKPRVKQTKKRTSLGVQLRYLNYVMQDKCMECDWAVITTEWNPAKKTVKNRLCCPKSQCVLNKWGDIYNPNK